ncbi:MAG: glycosyltransferase [Solirubrobacterales bacterium]
MQEFVPPDFPLERVEVIPPAIDPLSPKNMPLPEAVSRQMLSWLDDPEGWEIYRLIATEAESDPGIHVFTNLTGVGNVEVNAFQRLSDVVVQKSTREGFGLVVSEALWKGTPVVAGWAGGIPLQMADGAGGVLVDDVEGCAAALVDLLGSPERSRALGDAGRERVREHFLLPRLLLNELTLMLDLARERPISATPLAAGAHRDPVCGMAVESVPQDLRMSVEGREYRFCSGACLARFRADPRRYLRSRFDV